MICPCRRICAGSRKKHALLFAPTVVSFRAAHGEIEDGDDRGGLSAEMFSLFGQVYSTSHLPPLSSSIATFTLAPFTFVPHRPLHRRNRLRSSATGGAAP